jgi:hypothetical protein
VQVGRRHGGQSLVRDVDAGLQQALGQAEAAEASAGHGYPQPAHCPGPAGGFRGLPAASALVIACRIHHVAYVENR